MKRLTGIRKFALAGAIIGIAAFAMGCGQTLPTGVDVEELQTGQAIDLQSGNAVGWEQAPR